MARLDWDKTGEKKFEMGTDRGVLYPQDKDGKYPEGYVWNGLTAVTESPGGAEPTDLYADNIKYASMRSAETFGCTIESYTYPTEFEPCDGSHSVAKGVSVGQQSRMPFGLSYRTLIGNDTVTEEDDGYKIHLVYGCTASPSEKGYSTVSDSPDAITLSWEISTTPVNAPGLKPTATIVIDSTQCDKEKLKMLEDILYGTDAPESGASTIEENPGTGDDTEDSPSASSGTKARLPLPEEIIKLFATE